MFGLMCPDLVPDVAVGDQHGAWWPLCQGKVPSGCWTPTTTTLSSAAGDGELEGLPGWMLGLGLLLWELG